MKFTYCPKCGGELDNTFKLEQDGDFVPKCKKCGFMFFQNSKPTASVIPIVENKIIMATRAIDPNKGKLDIIGGFLQDGEDVIKGAKREFYEETGVRLTNLNYLGIYIGTYSSGDNLLYTFNATYTTTLLSNSKLTPHDDVAGFVYLNKQDLKKADVAFSYLKNVLADVETLLK